MTYAPRTLLDLSAFWAANGGAPLGVVGDSNRHCSGYHLGKDRIYGNCACRPDGTCEPGLRDRDYSVQHPRDKAGLTNGASAFDIGKLGGSLTNLYRFSAWLVKQCQAKAPGTEDIREVIYWNPTKARVERYSGVDGEVHSGPGNGDLSHKTHTHISYFRDSEDRDKRPVFAAYFLPAMPDTATEEPMGLRYRLAVTIDTNPLNDVGTASVVGGGHYIIRADDKKALPVKAGTPLGVTTRAYCVGGTLDEQLGQPKVTGDRTNLLLFNHDSGRGEEVHAILRADTGDTFTPLPDPTPYSKDDVTAEVSRATATLSSKIATARTNADAAVTAAQTTRASLE